MKKALLILLVSGLLIACLAGSAAAGFDIVVQDKNGYVVSSGPDIKVKVGETIYLTPVFSYDGTDTTITDPNQGSYSITKGAIKGNIANIDIYCPQHYILPLTDKSDETYKDTKVVNGLTVGVIELKILGGQVGDKYAINIVASNGIVYTASCTVTATTIPEFPTVALPVAALLGLIFIFGRKKGDI